MKCGLPYENIISGKHVASVMSMKYRATLDVWLAVNDKYF